LPHRGRDALPRVPTNRIPWKRVPTNRIARPYQSFYDPVTIAMRKAGLSILPTAFFRSIFGGDLNFAEPVSCEQEISSVINKRKE
jgi:hypothetical protein